ncbi:MAG: discoidin domain-containing protein [Saprospiraceae bacterium]|nr:discoidin domain-containing protein [Saprospiraceae bacterium]
MNPKFALLALALSYFSFISSMQAQFTPYDDLPGLTPGCKPHHRDDAPEWARMLYQFPVNAKELHQKYEEYKIENPEIKNAYTRYYALWKRAVLPFADEEGIIHMPNLDVWHDEQKQMQVNRKQGEQRINTGGNWTFLGPKETYWLNENGSATAPKSCPWQLNVYSIDVAPSNDNILYAGTETGFINKSIDKGSQWTLLAPQYAFGGGVTAIVIHPENHDIVYAAAGNQVHQTKDGGASWRPLLGSERFYADRLYINPDQPNQLLAASSKGLYVSGDGGISWINRYPQPVYDAAFRTDNPNVIFALTVLNDQYSLITSNDGGTTFTTVTSFPSTYVPDSGGLLAVTPANPDLIYALMLAANNTPVLLKGSSTTGNLTWKVQALGRSGAFPMDNGQGYYDLALEVSPLNENVLFAGTTTLYKSTNGGSTFSAVGGYAGNFSIHPDVQDLKMLPTGETWVATDGGISMSTDNFTNASGFFVRVNGLAGSDFWGFDQGWNEDLIVGGRYHNGNTAIADFYQPKALRMGGAESPTGWVMKGKKRSVAFDDLGNGWVLPAKAEGRPEGRFLFTKFPNMDEYGGRRGNLVHHPHYFGTLYTGADNAFWKSDDGGINWTLLYSFPDRVRYLQISYSQPNILYADIVGKGLYRSADGGKSWEARPSLTATPYGNSNWRGKLFFEISPNNPDVIYACLQNGTWSADIGKVFYSTNGGGTWTDFTGSVNEYLKCLVVQPDPEGNDLVYLFTQARGNKTAKVFIRNRSMSDWDSFDNQYPAGMNVNMALPFFRDSKIRVGGNNGVWESPLHHSDFQPVILPWAERKELNCTRDTLQLDDHSIVSHADVSWQWEILPAPLWHNGLNQRNPKIIPGKEGSYQVTLIVKKGGKTYTKVMPDFFQVKKCPSVDDCTNPDWLDKKNWKLISASSQEVNDPGLATMAFDGNTSTIWHTRWTTGDDLYPHELRIALQNRYKIYQFEYLTRQDGVNGRIKAYELYLSNDSLNWGTPVASGTFANTSAPQSIQFPSGIEAKFFRIKALSEVNNNPWASAAEFSLKGCYAAIPSGLKEEGVTLTEAYPVPCTDQLVVTIPEEGIVTYRLSAIHQANVRSGSLEATQGRIFLDTKDLVQGMYLFSCRTQTGNVYAVRFTKL